MKGDYNDSMCAKKLEQYQKCLREGMQAQHMDLQQILNPYLETDHMKK